MGSKNCDTDIKNKVNQHGKTDGEEIKGSVYLKRKEGNHQKGTGIMCSAAAEKKFGHLG